MLRLNDEYRSLLSNDLGAIAGLMFDVGTGRYVAPPRMSDTHALNVWAADLQKVREESAAAQRQYDAAREGDATHTEIQGWLRDLGRSLGFDVWIAGNDRGRPYGDGRLGDGCLAQLPDGITAGMDSVRLIDVVWIAQDTDQVVAAFEVEHSTSIYSGIVRMLDLALGTEVGGDSILFLVAPDNRRDEVEQQLCRPAFSRVSELNIRYLPYSQLKENRGAIARFGAGVKPLIEISQQLHRRIAA